MPDPTTEDPPIAQRLSAMPTRFTAQIDSWWKLAGIVGALITGSVTLGIAIASYLAIPNTVKTNSAGLEALTVRVAALESARTTAESEARRSRESIEMRLERLECLVVAGRRGTPIEECL